MIKKYTYKELQKYLQKQSSWSNEIFDRIKIFSNAGLFLGNMLMKLPMAELAELMSAVDVLCDMGKGLCHQMGEYTDFDYYGRWTRIQYTYGIAAQVAYFEELRKTLKDEHYGKLYKLLEKGIKTRDTAENRQNPLLSTENDLSRLRFTSCYVDYETPAENVKEKLLEEYRNANNILLELIPEKKWLNEEEWRELRNILEQLPYRAYERYCALYIALADQNNDFALFMQWTNQQMLADQIKQNSDIICNLIKSRETKIDVGLSNLRLLTEAIEKRNTCPAEDPIVEDLKNRYDAMLERSVIEAGELEPSEESQTIIYPKISEAFIPQAFKLLVFQKDMKVEEEKVWENCCIRDDLTEFILEYLNSEKSITHPLVILGQPGSGKSLLTTVLAARLTGSSYTVVRIPLREANAEEKLDALVENEIRKLTGRPLESGFGGFSAEHAINPVLIILDGYDELLQARESFSTRYIEEVRNFQKVQCELKRPVRVIVTSRVTLMNKVALSEGTAILKLLPFDAHKKERWIQIWNQTNETYFHETQVCPFVLPENAGIQELAEQPLLLLMLAIYDSESNELAKAEMTRRTELYSSLFHRFVQREQSRYIKDFEELNGKEKEEHIQKGMKRLGIAAIGMYNRGELAIRTEQLEADLKVLLRENGDKHSARSAEKLIGGFFFIHRSSAKSTEENPERQENAYEFLHNTFGEFFAADFILKVMLNAIRDVRYFQSSGRSKESYRIDAPCFEDCFYCLMYVPLFTRPVIVQMIHEYAWTVVTVGVQDERKNEEWNEFVADLKETVREQINTVLDTRVLPNMLKGGSSNFDREMPVYGYLATYTMNLVILAAALSKDGFRIRCSHADGYTWERLTMLWRSWFCDSDMLGLTDVITTKQEYDIVTVTYAELPEMVNCEGKIDTVLAVANILADPFLTALAGVHTSNFQNIIHMQEDEIASMLDGIHPDLYLAYTTNRIRMKINELWRDNELESENYGLCHQLNEIIYGVFNGNKLASTDEETEASFLGVVETCLTSNILFTTTIFSILIWFFQNRDTVFHEGMAREVLRDVDSEIRLISHIKMLKGHEILMAHVYPESKNLTTSRWITEGNRFIQEVGYLTMVEQSFLSDAELHLASAGARDNGNALDGFIKSWEDIPKLFCDPLTLKYLIETNVNWVSFVLWSAVRSGQFSEATIRECVTRHFDVLFRIMSYNEGWIPLHAIDLSCRAAKKAGTFDLAEKMESFLQEIFHNYQREPWHEYLYRYPWCVIDCVKLLPETAASFVGAMQYEYRNSSEVKSSIAENSLYKEQFGYSVELFMEYVAVVRFLVCQVPEDADQIKKSMFVHLLSTNLWKMHLSVNAVTLKQMKHLLWFAEFTDDVELKRRYNRLKKDYIR